MKETTIRAAKWAFFILVVTPLVPFCIVYDFLRHFLPECWEEAKYAYKEAMTNWQEWRRVMKGEWK